jgi:hypothetical protein
LYGGINNANLTMGNWVVPQDPNDQKPQFEKIRRLTFGATCELPLSKYLFLQPEIAFTQKGTIMTLDSGYSDIGGSGSARYTTVNNLDLNYIQLPVLVKFRFQLTNPQKIYPHENSGRPLFMELYAGPVLNYLIAPKATYSQTVVETYPGSTNEFDEVYKIENTSTQNGLKSLDFSAALGANIKWKINRKTYLYLDARYSMNFMNINDTAFRYGYLDGNGNTKINTLSLKNSGNLALTVGITRTFTKRLYWDHPRQYKRRF